MPTTGTPDDSARLSSPPVPILLLCVVFSIVCLAAINDLSIYTPDSTRYLVWARSLAFFDGYHDTTVPDAVRYVVHAPLYPLLLAPVALLFPLSVTAAKLWTLLFGLLGLMIFYRWNAHNAGRHAALVACIVLAASPLYLMFSTEVLSDIPFAAIAILLFSMVEVYLGSEQPSFIVLTTLSVIISAGTLLREIGFSLLLGTVLFMLIQQRWRHAVLIGVVPILVYAAWYVRNEIVVAGFELPSLTNARLFTHHFFTSPEASLLHELIARIGTNISVYANSVGKLLFFPFHSWLQFDVVFLDEQPLSALNAVLDVVRIPLILGTAGSVLYGAYLDLKTSPAALHRFLVLAFYIGIILIYPVNDIRFMVPLLVLMTFWFGVTLSALIVRSAAQRALRRMVLFGSVGLLLLPNIVWDAQFVSNCRNYNSSPLDFYASTRDMKRYPSHFTKPFRLVGAWITAHADSSPVILTQWKDLACWVSGIKVYSSDQTVPLDDFESVIRDYGITHLVSVVQKSGVREFDVQMHQSGRFRFTPVERIANVEIYSVAPARGGSWKIDSSTTFRQGISLLRQGRYHEAVRILDEGRKSDSTNLPLAFYSAVARGFDVRLEEASEQLSAISSLPQSLMYAEEAAAHRQIIDRLTIAQKISSRSERADEYFKAGGLCWNLGYRFRARELMRQSLGEDSTFFPAMILGIHFALVEADTAEAQAYLSSAESVQQDNVITKNVAALFMEFDSLKGSSSRAERSRHYDAISSLYSSLRLTESAIDNVLLAVREDPENGEAWHSLSALYIQRRRYGPARTALERALALKPGDQLARRSLQEVLGHF